MMQMMQVGLEKDDRSQIQKVLIGIGIREGFKYLGSLLNSFGPMRNKPSGEGL